MNTTPNSPSPRNPIHPASPSPPVLTGYQQTEIGVIPDDWNEVQLGEYALKVGSGITPTGGEKVYRKVGRPFLRSQNVGWGILDLEEMAYITEEVHLSFASTEILEEDVFLNITGASIGRSAIANKRVVGGNVNQHVCIVRTQKDKVVPKFLNSVLLSTIGQKQIDSFQAGGNREGLNFGQIKSFKIPLPPTLTEQRAIAQALSDTDALIQSLDQLIAKKRLIKQGAMQQLLKPKPGWEVKKLGEITKSFVGGGTPSRNVGEYWGGNIFWATVKDLNSYNARCTQESITDKGLRSSASNLIKKGTPIVSTRMAVGKCVIYNVEVAINQDLKAIYLLKEYSEKYLFFYLQHHSKTLEEVGSGSTVKGISLEDLHKFIISIPPTLAEQKALAQTLSDMDTEIAALEAKRDKYRQVKQGMMQQLLTGKIRLV